MKKLPILLIFVLSVSLAAAAVPKPLSVWLVPATPQPNEFIYDYGYQDASVVVNHRAVMDNFKGTLQATGLKPGFTYQAKLEGSGSLASTKEERLANEMTGLSGRWWYNGNRDDAYYYDNKNTVNIIGYLVFDFFTADDNGNANVDIVSDESYHVLWCGPTAYSNTYLDPVDVTQSPFSDYTLKCEQPMLCHADDVIPEIERPGFSALPEGDYPNVWLMLTEESFHQSCGTWSTVMGAETSFSISADEVDFNANPVQSYGGAGQDINSAVTIEDGGFTLRIVGNGWKKVDFPYTITADTILEFDFQSAAEGEVHGIGFDTDNDLFNPVMVFKLHGTQNWGIRAFDNYAGEIPRHYIIPVGQYYTGGVLYMTFANDHDVTNPTAESVFKNIRVYEQTAIPVAPVAVDDIYSVNEDGILTVDAPGVLSNDSDANGDPLEANLVSDVSNGVLSLNLDGSFAYTPDAGFTGTDIFTYRANDGTADSNEATVTIAIMTPDVVNFYVSPVQSYGGGGQDVSAAVTIEDGGATLRIVGNGWKKVDFPYTITADTILEFDFQSAAEGEVHGIGFDTDNDLFNPVMVFKLHGTQNWGIRAFDNYAGEIPRHYIIPVGQYYTGDVLYMTFANDHDVTNPTAESVFKNIRVYEQTAIPVAPVAVDDIYSVNEDGILTVDAPGVLSNDSDANCDPLEANLVSDVSNGVLSLNLDGSFAYTPDAGFTGTDIFTYRANDGTADSNEATVTIAIMTPDVVNFYVSPVQSYGGGGQDVSAAVTIEDGGATLRIVGNGWKKVDFPYTITADTILEFDFQSAAEGEVHGIGFDTDNDLSNPVMVFKLHGTQNWGIRAFDNYAGEIPRHYIIPVGQYYTGGVLYMTFANDHDVTNPTAESVFKNVKVYELD